MKKLMVLALMAGLAACAPEPPKTDKAAEPAPKTAPPEPAAKTEEPKTDAGKTEAKTEAKAEPAAKTVEKAPEKAAAPNAKSDAPAWAAKLKPGLYARFETNMGEFTAELNEKEAPGTVANFAGLADGVKDWTDPKTGKKEKKPYYDGLIFHRIVDGFMIQGGDPTGTGMSGPGFSIKDEHNTLKHDKPGTLAMARTSAPDSAGSQFYVTLAATPFLDGKSPPYVVFGQVVAGLDVVEKIGKVETVFSPSGEKSQPVKPVIMTKIRTARVK